MRDLMIIGAGGFGAEAAWVVRDMAATSSRAEGLVRGWNLAGFVDSDVRKRQTVHAGYRVHGTMEQTAAAFDCRELWFFCAIGDNGARRRAAYAAQRLGWKPAVIVHPSALIADTASVLAGSYVGPGSIVSNNARVGEHVIVNMQVSVGHDVIVGDYCQLSPGSRISGFCHLEELVFVGSNAVLMPGTLVRRGATVGACSLTRGQVDSHTTVCGVPARVIAKRPAAVAMRAEKECPVELASPAAHEFANRAERASQ